jgi:hypothetical protein
MAMELPAITRAKALVPKPLPLGFAPARALDLKAVGGGAWGVFFRAGVLCVVCLLVAWQHTHTETGRGAYHLLFPLLDGLKRAHAVRNTACHTAAPPPGRRAGGVVGVQPRSRDQHPLRQPHPFTPPPQPRKQHGSMRIAQRVSCVLCAVCWRLRVACCCLCRCCLYWYWGAPTRPRQQAGHRHHR